MYFRVCLAACAAALMSVPAAAEPAPVTSKIDAVTVYPSGAEIVRVGRVRIEPGSGAVVFRDLPAEAMPGSIRVEGKATGPIEIGAVDTRRLFVPQHAGTDSEGERKRLEKEIETLDDARKLAEARVSAADTQRALIGNLTNLPNRPAPAAGAASGEVNWGDIVKLIGTTLEDVSRQRLEAETSVRDLERRINDLRGKLADLAPTREERTEVTVAVKAQQAVDADLTVRYQVPNASWTQTYDARLTTGTKTRAPALTLMRRATITQRTGEPWENVAIQLATARPTAGTAAPELGVMSVDYPQAAKPVPAPVAQQRLEKMAQPRARGLVGGAMDAAPAAEAPPMQDAGRSMATVTVAPFQATYAVTGRASVANTGEAKNLDLAADSFEPSLLAKAVPKRDAKAYLYAKLEVPRGSPMLPGRVSLFRDGTFVGNGHVPLLAGGETHELGFGADDLVRVRHAVVQEKRGETGLISSSKTDERNYRISVKNMHERAIDLSVLDQAPQSRNEEIKVDLNARPSPSQRDVDNKPGVVRWDLKLDPDQESVIDFGYRVTWPATKSIEYDGR